MTAAQARQAIVDYLQMNGLVTDTQLYAWMTEQGWGVGQGRRDILWLWQGGLVNRIPSETRRRSSGWRHGQAAWDFEAA